VASVTAAPQPPPEAEDLDVVEVTLSVLARKLRGELMLGLLEDFAAGPEMPGRPADHPRPNPPRRSTARQARRAVDSGSDIPTRARL
jgi:hypothetical protein